MSYELPQGRTAPPPRPGVVVMEREELRNAIAEALYAISDDDFIVAQRNADEVLLFVDQAVAEAEERTEIEAALARGFQNAWASTRRMLGLTAQLAASWGGIPVAELRQFLVNQGMTEADADECIAAAEAET